MTTALDRLNAASPDEASEELARCCGCRRWVSGMLARRPFADPEALLRAADEEWAKVQRDDVLEAFLHHPRIGDIDGLRKKFASTATWAAGEQAGAAQADESVLKRLAQGNRDYELRFGHIFIVCATGKSAQEMLDLLLARLGNEPDAELAIAAGEQAKITRLRLEKLLAG
ncbi:MAG: 2-oxo-4-hydroxy-4-carboxy-5-ureidoimidazoline decarboxylase [Deltaproteobacteria bacterium]|nr:2-oxo-4-hydroxy-4-carboxy-5-ureidoimidazoline decarboxylase [Deltaproteobacteria bacterium]